MANGIDRQFVVRNLDTGEVFAPSAFGIGPPDGVASCPPATDEDVVTFKRLFATFGPDERLYHAVSCRLWESLASFHGRKVKKRHAGIMFISNMHLSFAEENSQRKPVKIGIPLSEIVDLTSEDFGLSEGIVVSTMRDTKFFFEQFPSRNEAFTALFRTWSATQSSSADQLASIFDPLGGFSAVSSSALRPVAQAAIQSQAGNNDDLFAPQSSPASANRPPPPANPVPPAKPTPPAKPPQKTTSVPPTRSGAPGVPPRAREGLSSSLNDEHFMEIRAGDSWFMTLAKIYYWLGSPARAAASSPHSRRTPPSLSQAST